MKIIKAKAIAVLSDVAMNIDGGFLYFNEITMPTEPSMELKIINNPDNDGDAIVTEAIISATIQKYCTEHNIQHKLTYNGNILIQGNDLIELSNKYNHNVEYQVEVYDDYLDYNEIDELDGIE